MLVPPPGVLEFGVWLSARFWFSRIKNMYKKPRKFHGV